jgi:16S rRNA G966 N2-methylase RsmD
MASVASSPQAGTQLRQAPLEVAVKRSDPVYMAHGYLTKVPVAAIEPFLEAFTEPGDVVLDPFAGSGMTGVAAAMHGRRAVLQDVSVLGQHIGINYVRLVPADHLLQAGSAAAKSAYDRLGSVYHHRCQRCAQPAELSRRIWSSVIACQSCDASVVVYRALESAGWRKSAMRCPHCNVELSVRGSARRGEQPVLDTVSCSCSKTLFDQDPSEPVEALRPDGLTWPDVAIEPHRQMFQASALSRNNLTTTASFFSSRNIAALAALRAEIESHPQEDIRAKLLFVFTAILTRASKRYQWSRKRPLNAANQNYYIAPVFYEWNVFDLFRRKLDAVIHSDNFIRETRGDTLFSAAEPIAVDYRLASSETLDLPDKSIDYVFTDPPFGSNIFYSDMNLFHEAWLGTFTDASLEAVVDRSGPDARRRDAQRYEAILTRVLTECLRVLKDDGRLSLVFSNSSGDIWALLQRVIRAAGFVIDDDGISLLDKGQRSVKGLNSGYEAVVTVDLVITMRKRRGEDNAPGPSTAADLEIEISRTLAGNSLSDPSRVYLHVVRRCLHDHLDLAGVSFSSVVQSLAARGYEVDPASGRFTSDLGRATANG